MKVQIKSLVELHKLAKTLQKATGTTGGVFALNGELGAGKTTFSKFFLRSAGIKNRITSPTFVLMNQYRAGKLHYFHIDLYRLGSYKELRALGIPEIWQGKNNLLLIEWANKIRRHLPKNSINLKFKVLRDSRQIQILNAPKKMAKILGQLYN